MSLLIAALCLSGIYLNHKDLFDGWFQPKTSQATVVQYASLWDKLVGSDATTASSKTITFSGPLSTATSAGALQAVLEKTLREAKARWGDRELEKLEFKPEGGTLICKLTSKDKEQLTLDVTTGAIVARAESKKGGKPEKSGKPEKRENFGKWIKNLHTGKIGGMTGKLVVDLTSLSILALTGTGLYLWAWPRLRRRFANP